MSWRDVVQKFDPKEADRRIQNTGYCRRCQRVVTKYQKCPMNLPAPPLSPSCPMRENNDIEVKGVGAVTTASAGVVRRSVRSKKKEEDYGRKG